MSAQKKAYMIANAHTGIVICLKQLSGNSLASGSDDGKIKIWDITTGQQTKSITVAGAPSILDLETLNSDQYLVAALENGKIIVYDTQNNYAIYNTLMFHTANKKVYRLAKSLDTQYLYSGSEDFFAIVK